MQDVEAFYSNLPEQERITALVLRELILETLPGCREKLSWGAPFYAGRKTICFVWPASIPWGKLEEGVALGFSQANKLDHDGFLEFDDRKQIGRHVFLSSEEINVERVVDLLLRAKVLDVPTQSPP